MTPFNRFWMLCMVLASFALESSRAQDSDEIILVWAGQTETGYLRVELRNPDRKDPYSSRLVMKGSVTASVTTHAGQLVLLPADIGCGNKIQHLFVSPYKDLEVFGYHGPRIVAAITVDGHLHVYLCGPYEFRVRPDLKPLGAAD